MRGAGPAEAAPRSSRASLMPSSPRSRSPARQVAAPRAARQYVRDVASRGAGSLSAAVTAVATAPVARARPRRRWAGSREGRRRGAWRRPRCLSVAGAAGRNRANAVRAGRKPLRARGGQAAGPRGRGAASPVPGRSQPPAGKPEGAAAFRAARSRWQDGASPSHALLELIPLFCFPCPPSLSQKAARACVQLPNNSVSFCERVPETLLCNASPTFTGEETETQVASGTYPCQTMVPKYE